MSGNTKPKPAMVELRLQTINEGKFLKRANATLRDGIKQLVAHWRDTQTRDGKLKLTITIEVGSLEKSDSIFEILTKINSKLPGVASISHAKESSQGYAMTQPGGSNEGDPDQLLFTSLGSIAGTVRELAAAEAKADDADDTDDINEATGEVNDTE